MAGRSAVLFATVTALTALTAGAAAPALADGGVDPHPRTAAEVLRPVAPPPATAGGLDAAPAGAAGPTAGPDGIETARSSRPVAPGVRLTSFDRLEADKWLRVDALNVDLGGTNTHSDYLSSGTVSGRDTVSDMAARHDPGPGRRTVAAINADFFDINETGAPEGEGIENGAVVQSPSAGPSEALGFGPDSAGRVLQLYFDGTLTLPSGKRPLATFNAADVPADSIGVYTPAWGTADRALTVNAAKDPVAEVTVRDGRVVSVADRPGSGRIPDGTKELVGRGTGATALDTLRPGDPVSLSYRPRTDSGPVPRTAVSGREPLVVDGVAQNHDGEGNNTAAPRTAVGFSRDGSRMQVVTVDGRQADSAGITLTELGTLMKKAGSYSALNLDGGGSSTLVTRTPGSDALHVDNSPSDGSERAVANGLALTAPDGSGRLKGFWVTTRTHAAEAPTADPVAGGHPDRVFPGLTRQLTAAGYDETYGPAAGSPHWRTDDRSVGRVDRHGLFTAVSGGSTRVRATHGRASGATTLEVLDRLTTLEPTTRRVGLADASATGTFGLVGLDAHGDSAPIAPRDVTLGYDHARFTVTGDGKGSFTVTARPGAVGGQITASVGGVRTVLAVSVGLEQRQVASFDDAASWTFSQARASGSVAAAPDGHTGTALAMSYDFTGSTATRAAYANPPAPIPALGEPQSFTLWIKGDGHGAWPTLHLKDAAGTDQLLRGPFVTWTGWKQVTFTVPTGVAMPVSVYRFYLAETDPAKSYTGSVEIDDLAAQVPPAVALPAAPPRTDPLISTAADTRGRDWRFAVMSDAQFVAAAPDSDIVTRARRTLREIRAAKPDFVVIDGDLVDEGSPADLAFAHRVLDEELGDAVPWYYVPGNHEVMGGSIADFTAEFGPAHRVFDHKGTRFITLDTSSLTLRGGGIDQIEQLREQLDEAATDDRIGSVVVIEHVPPRDPTPQKGSRLGDRKEAAMLEQWLADFQHRTGKGAAFAGGHVGVFDASHVDGVPYLINGNSGKAPSAPADQGGFTGWSLVGVDHVAPSTQRAARHAPWRGGPDWLSVATRPRTDALTLSAPSSLPVGGEARVTATVSQGTRTVPVAFPVSADWRVTGPATYDPEDSTLTARGWPGTVRLSVTVDGVTREAVIHVTRR
ncbi:phosphodiester glycosidase family protein [Streptomyces bomunensis]|uniref:Phosphodiester glycosidase family protein n=1 Tax=Streptomyces montanisoli TaxID=2798581 RepID=A0A940MBP6_9ACTN|nr:phosphodiester glycosidase family protein [Streptomyces montanisoli]